MESTVSIIDRLTEGTEAMLACYNRLRSTTIKISSPSYITVGKYLFLALLVLSLIFLFSRYLFSGRSLRYATSTLVFGLVFNALVISSIGSLVLSLPAYLILQLRRKRLFRQFKPTLRATLEQIQELEQLFARYPEVPLRYLNEFYLQEIRRSLNTRTDLSATIRQFTAGLSGNQNLKRKDKIVRTRHNIFAALITLAKEDKVFKNHRAWTKAFAHIDSKKNKSQVEPPPSGY